MAQGNGNGGTHDTALARTLFDTWLRVWRKERWHLRINPKGDWRGATYFQERVVELNLEAIAEKEEPAAEILLHEIGGHAMQRLDDTPAAEHLLVERLTKLVYAAINERQQMILQAMIKRALRNTQESA
jgi:hypothetical protein